MTFIRVTVVSQFPKYFNDDLMKTSNSYVFKNNVNINEMFKKKKNYKF